GIPKIAIACSVLSVVFSFCFTVFSFSTPVFSFLFDTFLFLSDDFLFSLDGYLFWMLVSKKQKNIDVNDLNAVLSLKKGRKNVFQGVKSCQKIFGVPLFLAGFFPHSLKSMSYVCIVATR